MPQNFTQTLQTVSPSISIVEKKYDTSLGELGKTLGAAAEAIGEQVQARRDAETAGTFYEDLNRASANIERARDEAEQDRLNEIQRRNTALYDADPSNDALAIETFNREIERINLREQQQGIVLDSAKRAVVRKWVSTRPDLTEFFGKALTLDEKISKMREESANYASSQLSKFQELQQRALANGTTIGMEQMDDRLKREVAMVGERLQLATDSGKLDQPMFTQGMMNAANAELNQLSSVVMPLFRAAVQGDARAASQIKATVNEYRRKISNALVQSKAGYESETGQIVNLDEVNTYVNNYLDNLDAMITASDVRTFHDIERMAQDEETWGWAHTMIPWLPKDAIEKIGVPIILDILKNSAEHTRKLRTQFAAVAAAEAAGSPEAQRAMTYLRMHSEQMAKSFMGSPLAGNAENVKVMQALLRTLSSGQIVPQDLAMQANPIMNAVLFNIDTSNASPTVLTNLETAQIANTISSYNSSFVTGNILNPNSKGARQLQGFDQAKWEQAVQPLADQLVAAIGEVREEERAAFTFDPSKPNPFAYDSNIMRQVTGRADAKSSFVDAIEELNKYYNMVAATRRGGQPMANAWARRFIETQLQPPQIEAASTPAQQAISSGPPRRRNAPSAEPAAAPQEQQPQTGGVTSNPNDVRQYDYDELVDRIVE